MCRICGSTCSAGDAASAVAAGQGFCCRSGMYLRKAGRAGKRMYGGGKNPVDEFDLGTLSFTYGDSHKCILYA